VDYPVQHVTPSWSPDEEQFVFGGWTFGLEVYDLSRSKRKILAGPRYNVYSAQWSPSGKWIAAIQAGDDVDRLYIFSPDGSLYSMTEDCDLITDFQWAPEEDKIAFICYSECNELCPDGCEICTEGCENCCPGSDYLWLWNLE
jgi:Tol biopolymer transport system component